MLLPTRQRPQRRGIILLVVLALITLFASIGVAFVYFAEGEATKAQDQKAGETVKLPDADLMYNWVMRQIVFPTNNNSSALYTHSLLENAYGQSGVVPFSGSGPRPRLYRDNRAGVVDPQLSPLGTYTTNAGLIGQDELYRINRQGTVYNENVTGSLNPTYTYPDHKNAYLLSVAANYTDLNGTQHGPTAVARSFAREMKFRIAVIDPTVTLGMPNVQTYQDVIVNPYTSADYSFWTLISDPTITTMIAGPNNWWLQFYAKRITLPPLPAPLVYAATPGVTVNGPVMPPVPGSPVIQSSADGTIAFVVMDAATCRAHTLRPNPRTNPNFAPPSELGGDVKNLSPEVKTLVGFNGTTPIFANNDSYWMDLGFPAIPWSNNRKIKMLASVGIMDTDGKVNINTTGNLRGFDGTNGSYHLSSAGMGPWEINFRKLYPASAVPAVVQQMDQEFRQAFAGKQLSQNSFIRGKYGIVDPTLTPTNSPFVDPSTIRGGYWPLLRGGPFYSPLNVDGSYDNLSPPVPNYSGSPAQQLPGQGTAWGSFPSNNTAALGYSNAANFEWLRNGATRSPLFFSPYSPFQVNSNIVSNNTASTQRIFSLQNMEAMYRAGDTGSDKIESDLRRLMPIAFSSPLTRWQMSVASNDVSAVGVAPWFSASAGDDKLPRTTPNDILLDPNTTRPAGASSMLPWSAPATKTGEFVGGGTNPLWRSIFGNTDRIDLAKQLPDYPAPTRDAMTNELQQLNLGNAVVKAQYLVALHARQKLADQIFWRLAYLTHPSDNVSARWMAQLAVNIVDYIDNDDYPTWYQVPDISGAAPVASTANADNIVWGTELPRLVINEVYSEAVNSDTGPDPVTLMTKATADYHARHWVELYNPLNSATFGTWPDDANARLVINGTSVYRLVITPQTNMTTIRTNNANTMGYPVDTNNAKTNVIFFNGTTKNPATGTDNTYIPPSNLNYGQLAATTPPAQPANGFYLVAPPQQPLNTDTTSSFPTMTTNANNMYESPQMQVDKRIAKTSGPFTDNDDNRQAILLQRLANPYLPHNPVPEPSAGKNLFTTNPGITTPEAPDPTLPYNPYITIDYVTQVSPNHAVEHDGGTSGTPDLTPVEDRAAIGKLQPFAAQNTRPASGTNPGQQLWVTQTPDYDLATAGIQKSTLKQVQHTFLRHNSIEPSNPQYGQKAGGATVSANVNTIQLPFDWLVHLDRPPTSPAELLHVSGYRPHELTQQFHQMPATRITATLPTGPTMTLAAGTTVRFNGTFYGTDQGIPFTLKLNDLVYVTYTTNPGAVQVNEWVRVNNIDANYTWFEGDVSNSNVVNQSVLISVVVPFAHSAPWYRAGANVDVQSSNRIYRLLECLAVRNPGAEQSQVRFAGTSIGPILADGSRWIQLDNTAGISGLPAITTNDALLGLESGTPAGLQQPPGTQPINKPSYSPFTPATPLYQDHVGDSLVFFAGGNEYRAMLLEVDWQNNRIRTVLPDANLPAALPFTVDYTFHSGRQPGKINLNTIWDLETFLALVDTKPINSFSNVPILGGALVTDAEEVAKIAFQRLYQQRQPGFFYTPRLPGHTGFNNVGEDRPLLGMGIGDIAPDREIPRQGIGNTLLSARFQEAGPVPSEIPGLAAAPGFPHYFNTPERQLTTLFESYRPQPPVTTPAPQYLPDPGMNHPYRRFELLSKIWNNTTVRSNTFAVWVTIGFFEYDETTGLGAELGQIQGKNTRYRFFSIVDRTSVDSWLKSWFQYDSTNASINLFANSALFPMLDPRDVTYANIYNPDSTTTPVINQKPTNYPVKEVMCGPAVAVPGAGNVAYLDCAPEYLTYAPLNANPLWNMFGRMVQVTSINSAGNVVNTEVTSILNPTQAPTLYDPGYVYVDPRPQPPLYPTTDVVPKQRIFARLALPHAGAVAMIVRPLPVPPTVLHWTQMK